MTSKVEEPKNNDNYSHHSCLPKFGNCRGRESRTSTSNLLRKKMGLLVGLAYYYYQGKKDIVFRLGFRV
jgi:hypothetical protein